MFSRYGSTVGGLTLNEWISVLGLVMGVIGLVIECIKSVQKMRESVVKESI